MPCLISLLPCLGKVKTLRWGLPKRAMVFLFTSKLFGAPEADTLLPTQVIDDRGTHGMYLVLKWRGSIANALLANTCLATNAVMENILDCVHDLTRIILRMLYHLSNHCFCRDVPSIRLIKDQCFLFGC